jgi:hypothetical protein
VERAAATLLSANAVLLMGKKVTSGKSAKICLAICYNFVIMRETYEKNVLFF